MLVVWGFLSASRVCIPLKHESEVVGCLLFCLFHLAQNALFELIPSRGLFWLGFGFFYFLT